MTHPTLNQFQTVKYSRIYSLGAARGDLVVTNDDIAGPIDSSDEWIRQRTGIITRRRASKDLSLMDMAVDASNQAIKRAGIVPQEIGAVIFSTISHPYQTPSAAALAGGASKKRRKHKKHGGNPLTPADYTAPAGQTGGFFSDLIERAVVPFGLMGIHSLYGKKFKSRKNRH